MILLGNAKTIFSNISTNLEEKYINNGRWLISIVIAEDVIEINKCYLNTVLNGGNCMGGIFGNSTFDKCKINECSIRGKLVGCEQTPTTT